MFAIDDAAVYEACDSYSFHTRNNILLVVHCNEGNTVGHLSIDKSNVYCTAPLTSWLGRAKRVRASAMNKSAADGIHKGTALPPCAMQKRR